MIKRWLVGVLWVPVLTHACPPGLEDYCVSVASSAVSAAKYGVDEDGSRWVWAVYQRQGMRYGYMNAQTLNRHPDFDVTKTPQSGDIAWWPNMVALYLSSGSSGQVYFFKGQRLSPSQIMAGRGTPLYLAYRNRDKVIQDRASPYMKNIPN